MSELVKEVAAVAVGAEDAWARAGHQEDAFPAIAADALVEGRLAERFEAEAWRAAVAGERELPRQLMMQPGFGHPPITLWRSERLLVDLYFWLHPHTAVHSHAFCGAFTVLSGVSLENRYRAQGDREIGAGVFLGRVVRTESHLRRRGDVIAIEPGRRMIHDVWHATRPSLSLVLRTPQSAPDVYPIAYYPPGVWARGAVELAETAQKKIQLLEFLLATETAAAEPFLQRALADADDHAAFWITLRFLQLTLDRARVARLLETPDLRPREFHHALRASRTFALVDRYNESTPVSELESLVLALLVAGSPGPETHRILAEYDREADLAAALAGLAEKGAIDLRLNETAQEILAHLVTGADEAAITRALGEEYEIDDPTELREDVAVTAKSLREHPLLQELLGAKG